jgi:uncharacterized ubiquitin-like protein YukD
MNIDHYEPKKKQTTSDRLSDSNNAAQSMIDIATQKLKIKSNYYEEKLMLMKQNNQILGNIHTLLETYIQNNKIM